MSILEESSAFLPSPKLCSKKQSPLLVALESGKSIISSGVSNAKKKILVIIIESLLGYTSFKRNKVGLGRLQAVFSYLSPIYI